MPETTNTESERDRRLAEIVVDRGILSRPAADVLLGEIRSKGPPMNLAALLLQRGIVAEPALDSLLDELDGQVAFATTAPPARSSPPPRPSRRVPRLEPGGRIGPYVLGAALQSGGQGTVFRAEHETLRRPVAVKILDPSQAEHPHFTTRFLREARLASQVDHPNVVRVYDAGEEGGRYYLAMELVEGTDLDHLVRTRGPLPVAQAVRFAREAAAGLAAAHALGILHRDVKPGNILLDEARKRVVVTDFGLARTEQGGDVGLSTTGGFVGTPVTMSPEACAGEGVSPASDQYSLAASLFYLLAGEYPFTGQSALGLVQKHVSAEPPSLADRRPECPPRVVQAVARGMAKDPRARFPTIAEFAKALGPAGGRSSARLRRTAGRRLPAWAVPAGGALLVAIVAVLLALALRDPPPSGALPEAGEPPAGDPPVSAERAGSIAYPLDTEARARAVMKEFDPTPGLGLDPLAGGGLALRGVGEWLHPDRFGDFAIAVRFEPRGEGGAFGPAVYASDDLESMRLIAGLVFLGPDRRGAALAELRMRRGRPPHTTEFAWKPLDDPGSIRELRLVRRGEEWTLLAGGGALLTGRREFEASCFPGLHKDGFDSEVVLRSIAIDGTPDRR